MATPLGDYLRELRSSSGETLRDVEDKSDVSNAYLSQLEGGKITKPSPHILQKLALHYGVPYSRLMELAGYLRSGTGAGQSRETLTPMQVELLREGEDLTKEELESVAAFIRFMRVNKPKIIE